MYSETIMLPNWIHKHSDIVQISGVHTIWSCRVGLPEPLLVT